MTNRTYGVEIECAMSDFYNHYWSDSDSYYYTDFEQMFPCWEHKDEHCGIEVCSPVLSGTDGFKEIKEVCDWLIDHGAVITGQCGLHVHHGANDLSPHDILRVIKSWYQNQGEINLLVDPYRRTGSGTNEWCRGWTKSQVQRLEEMVKEALADGHGLYWEWGDRYKAINIHSLDYHGTLEIRQHEGTLDAEEIISWVEFGQAFIESVAKKRKRALAKTGETPILLDRVRLPKKSKDFYAKKMAMVR